MILQADEIKEAVNFLDAAIEAANPPNPCSGARMAMALSQASDYATTAREILNGLLDPWAS